MVPRRGAPRTRARYNCPGRPAPREDPLSVLRQPWPWTLAILAGMATLRLIHLGVPFDADFETQRVLYASGDWWTLLTHRYEDARHPQGLYLLLHAWEWFGIGEAWVRLPAVLASLGAAAALVALARPYVGTAGAVAAAALLALSAPLTVQSRDVSDLPLFLMLALLSSHLLLQGLTRPGRGWAIGYAVTAVAMSYTYYLAGAVLAAQLAALIAGLRRPGARRLGLALGVAVVLALPAWLDLAVLIRQDLVAREIARANPEHLWGEQDVVGYLRAVGTQLLPASGPWLAVPLLAAAGAVRWAAAGVHRPALALLGGLVVAGLGLAVLAVGQVRLAPHYLLFVLPALLVLAVAGALGPRDEFADTPAAARYRTGVAIGGALVLAAVAALYATDLVRALPAEWSSEGRDAHARVGAAIRDAGGPDRIVVDPDMLHTIVLYYAFRDPRAAYAGCRHEGIPEAMRCDGEEGELRALTPMGQLAPGWEQRSVERFRALRAQSLWFVDTDAFPNPALQQELRQTCRAELRAPPLTLYRCEPP